MHWVEGRFEEMVQQLLKITTTPMQYRINIEPARLEMKQEFIPSAEVKINRSEVRLNSDRAELHLDTYEARKSLGMVHVSDLIAQNAQKGVQSLSDKIREYVTDGEQMAKIEEGVTIAQIARQKMLQQPQLQTTFLPSTSAQVTYKPGHLETDWTDSNVSYDWKEMRNVLNYIPGQIRMEILEYAKVDIEYVGSPMYVPPSAAPDYVAPEA